MRVTDLSRDNGGRGTRIAARIVWEDRDLEDASLWLDFPADVGREVQVSPNAFLPTAVVCAMQRGERRVRIDGAVCPRHLDGLKTVAGIFATWFPALTPPRIEPTGGTAAPETTAGRAAICFSGGVDSLAALRDNRLTVDHHHSASIRDGLVYFGLNTYDFDGSAPRVERPAAFEAHCGRLAAFGDQAGLTIVPIWTNIRTLYPSWEDWEAMGLAAGLVAGAHALPGRIRSLTIASAGIGITSLRHGTHPLLDPHFSTLGLDVRTVDAMTTRLEKVRRVAEWPEALATLNVCLMFEVPSGDFPNCGKCEKCVRTMIELLLCGALDRASTFPRREVTAEMIRTIPVNETDLFYRDYRGRLAALGRNDLVRALDDRARAHQGPKSLLDRLFRR